MACCVGFAGNGATWGDDFQRGVVSGSFLNSGARDQQASLFSAAANNDVVALLRTYDR